MSENYFVNEEVSGKLSFVLRDENDETITLAAIGTLQLTLYNKSSSSSNYYLATINNRYKQDILDTNDVTVSSSGTIIWSMQPNDNIILDDDKKEEHHIALFEFYYGGSKASAEFNFFVRNLNYIS